jgi:putative phosphoribosyl transferase
MMFVNRADAGRALAAALATQSGTVPLVLGLPRGGLVVAAEVARALHAPLDVVLVKKLRAPGNPELAIGALSEQGDAFWNEEVVHLTGASPDYLEAEHRERQADLVAQQQLYRAVKTRLTVTDRSVMLVDDGLATGASMIAAVQVTALAHPREIIVAVPVSSPEALAAVQRLDGVHAVVALSVPSDFNGVGQFYRDFTQVSDAEVMAILKEFAH